MLKFLWEIRLKKSRAGKLQKGKVVKFIFKGMLKALTLQALSLKNIYLLVLY